MSPHIELDDEVFDYLKTQAEPFVDTPNTVLRRLLGIDDSTSEAMTPPAQSSVTSSPTVPRTPADYRRGIPTRKKSTKSAAPKRTRAATGTLLPEAQYERPLLKALADAGGQAAYRDVVDAVGRELKDDLMAADFEKLSSGSVRWQSRLQFVRLRLIERGYLDKRAPRGIWGITESGRAMLTEGESQ